MARKNLQTISGLGVPTAYKLTAVQSGKADIAITADVTIGTDTYTVGQEDGRVRLFKDADDFLKAAGALGMVPAAGMSVTFDGMGLVQPKPFTGNIIAKNQATVASYAARKTAAIARKDKLATEITLMQADPTVPAYILTEKQVQKTTVEDLITWLTAEITRINAILTP